MMTFNKLQQAGSVEEKQDRSKDRARSVQGQRLVALQKELPMAPNWMSSCKRTDKIAISISRVRNGVATRQ